MASELNIHGVGRPKAPAGCNGNKSGYLVNLD
jgi:hypothetical protein